MGKVRELTNLRFQIGDLVSRKSEQAAIHYCIIGFKIREKGERVAVLKSLFNNTSVVEAPLADLNNLLVRGKL